MLRNLWSKNCPYIEAQQAAARAHLEKERAKKTGTLVELPSRTTRLDMTSKLQVGQAS